MDYLPEGVIPTPSPPPRDYKLVKVDIGHGMTADLMACKKCGSYVGLVRVHNDWHKNNERPERVRTRR